MPSTKSCQPIDGSSKAVNIWRQLDDQGHIRLAEDYLREAGNFENVRGLDRSPRRLFSDPLYAVIAESEGPPAREREAPEPTS